jgi:hypothetical protein
VASSDTSTPTDESKVSTEITSKGAPRVRPPRSCSKCGELGRRSDTCGITHNVSTSPASTSSPPPLSASRSCHRSSGARVEAHTRCSRSSRTHRRAPQRNAAPTAARTFTHAAS